MSDDLGRLGQAFTDELLAGLKRRDSARERTSQSLVEVMAQTVAGLIDPDASAWRAEIAQCLETAERRAAGAEAERDRAIKKLSEVHAQLTREVFAIRAELAREQAERRKVQSALEAERAKAPAPACRAAGRTAKRQAGGHIGGTAPFGFRKLGAGRAARLEPDPEQQAALATIHKLAAQGVPSRTISAEVRSRHGLAISHVSVRAALTREARA